MDQIKSNIYQKTYDSGRTVWMVRWWNPNSSKWISLVAGKTEHEAILFEKKLRQELVAGIDPKNKVEKSQSVPVPQVIQEFYTKPRFLC